MVFQNDILAGSSGASGTSTAVHTIDQSIRFDATSDAFMYGKHHQVVNLLLQQQRYQCGLN